MEHHHQHDGRDQDEDYTGSVLAEHRSQPQGDQATDHTAALESLSLAPQGLDQLQAPLIGAPGQNQVEQAAHQHWGEQGAPHPQPYRAAPVEDQDPAGHQQHGGQQPVAVADQALDQAAEKVDKDGLNMEVAKGGENGQQQLKQAVEEASFCMMAQNASAMLARTGLLFHRQVADYAYDENWKRMFTVGINYINGENWISDGKYYSSSTTIAALDMTLGLIGDMLDIDIAEKAAEEIGYSWDSNLYL